MLADEGDVLFSVLFSKSICAYVNVGASAAVIGLGIDADILPWVASGVAAVEEEHEGKSRLA